MHYIAATDEQHETQRMSAQHAATTTVMPREICTEVECQMVHPLSATGAAPITRSTPLRASKRPLVAGRWGAELPIGRENLTHNVLHEQGGICDQRAARSGLARPVPTYTKRMVSAAIHA